MIAIPARSKENDVLITTIFGRTKEIAFVDEEGQISVQKNPYTEGSDLADWLVTQGVDQVVFRNIGAHPCDILLSNGIKLYATTDNRAPIEKIVADLQAGRLVEVTEENKQTFVKPGQHRHQGGHQH